MNIIICQILLLYLILLLHICWSKNEIPPFFIFGDSLVDVGNNFYVNTLARPDFPNGIDFGNKKGIPSGRYCNGRTVVDLIEQELGMKNFTPPYLAPTTTGDELLNGANFASSATGILAITGSEFGDRVELDRQINYFAATRKKIIAQIGVGAAKKLLNNAIHFVITGANDLPLLSTVPNILPNHKTVDALIDLLISRFRSQLTKLYNLDARKFVVGNVGAIGCAPLARDLNPRFNVCVPHLNQYARTYNKKLKISLQELTTNSMGSIIIHVDVYAIAEDIVRNYKTYGFENADKACCHSVGAHGGLAPCGKGSLFVCKNRTKYVYWDAFHFTENANQITANYMMDGDTNYISPINLRQLFNS